MKSGNRHLYENNGDDMTDRDWDEAFGVVEYNY